ncbi:MAG: peptidoglycan-binding protein [Polyangiaceae bacterium]
MTTSRVPTSLSTVLRRGAVGGEVRQVQELLNLAGSRPRVGADGVFGELTEQSVRYFQSNHGLGVDGRVGPATFAALNRAARRGTSQEGSAPNNSSTHAPSTTGTGDFCFPLAFKPSPDWKGGGRYFGAARSHGRLHAGCDLLGPRGTTIHAIADGTLVRAPYYFYSGTYAVELRHGPYLVRYGEILGGSYIGGQSVRKGEPICQIGRLESGSSMLHFEMYSNGASTASLTTSSGPYKRRGDLINPSPHLDQWVHNLPRG